MVQIAVITGDLIDSTRVLQPVAFRKCLKKLLGLMETKYRATTSMYRGDGFQVALELDANAFEAAVLLRTGLVAKSPGKNDRWDARIAIAFGDGKLSATEQNGPAFINSGRALDAMKKAHLCVYAEDEYSSLALGVATDFADDIVNNWTSTEAEVLFLYLKDRASHQSIADQLGKQRPTITEALQRAKYSLINRYINDMQLLVQMTHA